MYNYCTLFDSYYLSRGLAMYDSLLKQTSEFHLYVFAFDDLTYNILLKMRLENVTVISLTEFESQELLNVKKDRSKAEYCWTCTPSVISYVFEHYNTPDCTYIDSDLYFYSDPSVLITEMEENHKNVLITEHRYSFLPRLYEEKRSGRFCVQFMTFKNEVTSLEVLEKWRKQCIDWCYAKHEDGKFGDQKYLDPWPDLYNNVHILEHIGGGVAPWNQRKYTINMVSDSLEVHEISGRGTANLIFYHFQYVKYMGAGTYDIGWYFFSEKLKKELYFPYIRIIEKKEKELAGFDGGYERYSANIIKVYSSNIWKKTLKLLLNYNIIGINYYGISD